MAACWSVQTVCDAYVMLLTSHIEGTDYLFWLAGAWIESIWMVSRMSFANSLLMSWTLWIVAKLGDIKNNWDLFNAWLPQKYHNHSSDFSTRHHTLSQRSCNRFGYLFQLQFVSKSAQQQHHVSFVSTFWRSINSVPSNWCVPSSMQKVTATVKRIIPFKLHWLWNTMPHYFMG